MIRGCILSVPTLSFQMDAHGFQTRINTQGEQYLRIKRFCCMLLDI
jgi:hypothetical protein